MMLVMSTSLNVVSMAVVFLASTSLRANGFAEIAHLLAAFVAAEHFVADSYYRDFRERQTHHLS